MYTSTTKLTTHGTNIIRYMSILKNCERKKAIQQTLDESNEKSIKYIAINNFLFYFLTHLCFGLTV